MDLRTATTVEVVAALAAGEVSSVEVLDAAVARYEQWNPVVNAVVVTDLDRARERARAADEATTRGERWGPLHGLPVTLKDTWETEGLVTAAGVGELAGHVPPADADLVARLKAAGAVVWAKTNTPPYAGDIQTANDLYGLTRNPWDPSRTAGGSSGGAAVAVATGMTTAELGSDIGGSIRQPSHCNGVFGHKSTFGSLPLRGHIPPPPGARAGGDLGVGGPLGRSAGDLDLLLSVLAAPGVAGIPGAAFPDPAPAARALQGLRVGVWFDDPACPTGAAVRAVLGRLAEHLDGAGAVLDDVRTATPLERTNLLYLELLSAALAPGYPAGVREHQRRAAESGPPDDPATAAARGFALDHVAWQTLDEQRAWVRHEWDEVFEQVDVVLAPICPVPAFPHDVDTPFGSRTVDVDGTAVAYRQLFVWAGLATLPGLPATAVPVGRTEGGLPVGVQVVGPHYADRTTIAVAGLLEPLGGGFVAPPDP